MASGGVSGTGPETDEPMVEDAVETPRHTQTDDSTSVPVVPAPDPPTAHQLQSGIAPDFSGFYDSETGVPLCAFGARSLLPLSSQDSRRLANVPGSFFGAIPVMDRRLVLWHENPCLRCAKVLGTYQAFCVRPLPGQKCRRCSTLGVKCDSIPEKQLASFRIVQQIFQQHGVTADGCQARRDWVRVVEGDIRKDPSLSPSQSRTRLAGAPAADRMAALEARLDRMEGTMAQILQALNSLVSVTRRTVVLSDFTDPVFE